MMESPHRKALSRLFPMMIFLGRGLELRVVELEKEGGRDQGALSTPCPVILSMTEGRPRVL